MSLKKLTQLALALLISVQTILPVALADFLPVQVYATDAVAGYPAALRTSLINPNQDVRFVVEKPDGAVVQIPAQADLEGIAKTDLYGHQTKIAGEYAVAVVYPGSDSASPQSSFRVYPDQVSTSQSTVFSTEQMLEAGNDTTFLVVTLYDQYLNPIPNHLLEVISSRNEDTIEALQGGVTDQNGRASFKVQSQFPGVSIYSVLDVSVNQVLADREEVVYFAPTASVAKESSFLDFLKADIGQGEILPGPVNHFEIQGLSSTVKVGEELSVTIEAKDKDGNTAKNYTGTILFSVPDDDNAVLPNNGEYTFRASDLGKFSFDLSLMFSKVGNQVFQVFDKNDFKLSGEFPIEVVPSQAVVPGPTSTSLKIKAPPDGSELGSNLVIITGTGNENINLKIFDNDVKIGDSETDGDGFFSFEAKNLNSGSHSFYVISEAGEVSKAVTILIDTLAPVMNSFEIFPDGSVLPGSQVEITVTSEPGLEEAKIRIQGIEEMMSESDPGTYEVTVIAPVTDGSFPVDVILIDGLANKGEFLNKGVIKVSSPQIVTPPTVLGLQADPGDSAVSLQWEPVLDHERPIQNYRIYYGTVLNVLDQTLDTEGSAATWELRGLENDRQYFMAVKAIDSQGLESAELSVVIAATPVLLIECGNGIIEEGESCDDGNTESGDGCSLICEIEPEPEPIPVEPLILKLEATPYDSAVVLSWPSFPNVQAYYYQVVIGFAPGQYVDSITTPDNRTSITVSDLINNVPYYFAVVALDLTGNPVSALTEEVQVVPNGAGFRPAAYSPVPYDTGAPSPVIYDDQLGRVPRTDEVGPESVWVLMASMVFAYFFYHHKRKVLKS